MIRQVESEVEKPLLLLDGGALLFDQPVIPESLLPARKIQADGIGRAMAAMNYAAIGIAPHDLAAGPEFLVRLRQEHDLPLLSANLADQGGKLLFKPFRMTKAGEITIAVIGLTGEVAGKTPAPAGYRLLPWREVLADTLKEVRRHGEMIILLSSYPEAVNREIATSFPEISIIIGSGGHGANRPPQLAGNTLLTQVAARGKYLGRLDIDWQESHRWEAQSGTSGLQQAKAALDRINWRLGRLEKRQQNKNDPAQNSEHQQLRQEQERLQAEIAQHEKDTRKDETGLSTFTAAFVPLKTSLPEDPEVQKIITRTKKEINGAGRIKDAEADREGAHAPGAVPATMTGWNVCASCHPEQTAFWQKTRHAGAWQTLAGKRQQFNQDCLLCHVTLPDYDRQTVFRENLLAAVAPELQGVGCETCHGPGRNHAVSPGQAHPVAPTPETCLACHAPEHDHDFSYDRKVRLIRCPPSASNDKGAA